MSGDRRNVNFLLRSLAAKGRGKQSVSQGSGIGQEMFTVAACRKVGGPEIQE